MIQNKFGEMVFDQDDICDMIMQDREPWRIKDIVIDPGLDLERLIHVMEDPDQLITWTFPENSEISVPDYDSVRQSRWFMPEEYRVADIAQYVLSLCQTPEQLQRVGEELLLFQDHGLFDLLRYLRYLVDVMRTNHVIWGVGRGSSVSSYVLYLLDVHRIDSMYYDLDPREFLR